MADRRVKIVSNGDDWTKYLVSVDGRPLDVVGVSLGVNVDELTTVTITMLAPDVELDIQGGSHLDD